jgi:hypothetical protein
MDIRIENVSRTEIGCYVSLSTEKHNIEVVIRNKESYLSPVTVANRNSSSRAWNPQFSAGKDFNSIDEAVANYKTAAIKEMITVAAELAA